MAGMNGFGSKLARDPFLLISVLVGITVITNLVTTLFGTIITNFSSLNTLSNFTFSGLFADDGLGEVVLSALVLIAVLAIIGVRTSGSKR